ncbi:hypothetical protein LTR66_000838 [Elasticomyces elasticus]|nr:hypothetical protein LTR66_000838 [Elasticomyces elasticus]
MSSVEPRDEEDSALVLVTALAAKVAHVLDAGKSGKAKVELLVSKVKADAYDVPESVDIRTVV